MSFFSVDEYEFPVGIPQSFWFLFVCAGNILRSVAAEIMFRKKVYQEYSHLLVSADTSTKTPIFNSRRIDPTAQYANITQYPFWDNTFVELFKRYGISETELGERSSQIITPTDVQQFADIYAMDAAVLKKLKIQFPEAGSRIKLFPEIAKIDIPSIGDYSAETTLAQAEKILKTIQSAVEHRAIFPQY